MRFRQVTDSADPDLGRLASLMARVFPDPNTVLGLDRMQAFLAVNQPGAARQFFVVVATDPVRAERVVGGTVFSYVARSNCGFSEYMLTDATARGQGLGRALFETRKMLLDGEATRHGHAGCNGVFIEVDNPERVPPDLAELERQTSVDPWHRLAVFAHLGFRRVDVAYVQPPLGPDKRAIDYMDLLFAPANPAAAARGEIPAEWMLETLEPVWSAWTPETVARHLAAIRRQILGPRVALLDPLR